MTDISFGVKGLKCRDLNCQDTHQHDSKVIKANVMADMFYSRVLCSLVGRERRGFAADRLI